MPTPTRAKPPVPAWIIRERKRLGLKPREVAERLTAMGLTVTEGTVRTWEAGRNPHPDNIEGLERIFGSVAPGGIAGPADQSALIAALDRQSQTMEALVILLAHREGFTLDDLAGAERSIVDRVVAAALPQATTEAIERDRNREPVVPPRPDRTRPTLVPSKS